MTTTEWVERYNRAFAQADFEQGYWDRRLRGITYPRDGWDDVDWTLSREAHEALFPPNPWSPEGKYYSHGLANKMRQTAKVNERLNDPFGAIPSNPSHSEPKEVVDDGQAGLWALNRKE